MFRKSLLTAATALSLTMSQAMAAGEQLQLIQDAEQLKTALAGEPVVLTPQIVSVTITSSSDAMFPSGDWKLPTNTPLLDKMVPHANQVSHYEDRGARLYGQHADWTVASGGGSDR